MKRMMLVLVGAGLLLGCRKPKEPRPLTAAEAIVIAKDHVRTNYPSEFGRYHLETLERKYSPDGWFAGFTSDGLEDTFGAFVTITNGSVRLIRLHAIR